VFLISSLTTAFKKLAIVPALVVVNAVSVPLLFESIATFLGPHLLAGFGAVIGCAIRFFLLRMQWRRWPIEAACAAALGIMFGQAQIPVIAPMLEKVSPEMFPVSNGAAIGILMAAGAGFVADFFRAYKSGEAKP